MALFRVTQEIVNDVWKLTFVNDPLKLSEDDKFRMRRYGEPEIDLGGTFLAESENEFTLPEKKGKVRSDFPFTQDFDSRDSDFEDNTQTKVEAYRDQIITRLTTAFETLRDIEDTFTADKVYNI